MQIQDPTDLAAEALALLDQAVFLTDAQGSIEFAGGAVRACSGQRPEDLVGQAASKTMAQGSISTSAMMQHLESVSHWSSHAYNPLGQSIWISLARRSNAPGALLTLRLFTAEERKSKEQLRALTSLLEPVGIGVWTHDIASDRVWYSPLAYAITGLDPKTPIDGTSIIPLLSPEMRRELAEAVMAHMGRGAPYHPVVLLNRPDGSSATVQLFGSMSRDKDGQPTSWLGGVRDLSAEHLLESQLEDLRSQFEHIQRVEGLGLLTGGIAHDFNNLLTAMLGWLSFVEEAPELESQTRGDLEQVKQAALHASSLTSQLLRYGRKEGAGSMPVNLYTILSEVTGFLRRPLPSGVELKLLDGDPELRSHLDPGQLHQVLTNLVTNASHAIDPPGQITLSLTRRGDQACIEVRDTGKGMSKETLQRAFEPFFTTREAERGTGLGLATCQRILKELGGDIQATSAPGQGSCFTILLPLTTETPQITDEQALPPTGSETVLLVEQAHMVRRVTARLLIEAGYTVLAVDSAQAALSALESQTPSLMVADLYLPLVSGPLLAEPACALLPSLKVLYTTSTSASARHPDLPPDQEPRRLAKPYTRHALLGWVRSVLDD